MILLLVALALSGGTGQAAERATCPVSVQVEMEKGVFTDWEIVAGTVTVSNRGPAPVPVRARLRLLHGGRVAHAREVALEIPRGRAEHDLPTALGTVPLIRPEEAPYGEWQVEVELLRPACPGVVAGFRVVAAGPPTGAAWRSLIGYWPLDEGTGNRGTDWSGGGRQAELTAPAWSGGRGQAAVRVGEGGAGIRLPQIPAPGPAGMTLAFWLAADEPAGGVQPLFSPAAAGPGWGLVLDRGRPVVRIASAGVAARSQGLGRSGLLRGRWTHLALTLRGERLALHLDGRPIGEVAGLSVLRGPATWLLGGSLGAETAGFQGRLQQVRLFDRALAPEEIRREAAVSVPTARVAVDPGRPVGPINPLLFGVNVEGGGKFLLPEGMGLRTVRWPGGCFAEGFHWREAVDPARPRRARGAAACEGEEMSRPAVPVEVGPDELMAILRPAGAEPILTVNFATGTAQEAANWVEYMNGESPGLSAGRERGWTPESFGGGEAAPRGYFAWLREHFGARRPHGVRYWAVGNEFEARSAPAWTRDVREFYLGGSGTVRALATRDPERVDWSLERRTSLGRPHQEFFVPFVPLVAGSERVEVLPILGRDPLELGRAESWRRVERLEGAGRAAVYRVTPDGRLRFGDGVNGAIPPAGSVVRVGYVSGPHDGFVAFARKMKEVDPTILVGSAAAATEIPPEAAGAVDFLAANVYSPLGRNDPSPVPRYYRIQAMAPLDLDAYVHRVFESFRKRKYPGIHLAVTEYTPYLFSPHQRSLAAGLYVADALQVLARRGVSAASYYSLETLTDEGGGRGRPSGPGWVFRLLQEHLGSGMVATSVGGPIYEARLDGRRVRFPLVEALGTLREQRGELALLLLQKQWDAPTAIEVRLAEAGSGGIATLVELTADSPFAEQLTPRTRTLPVGEGIIRWVAPPHSLTILRLPLERGGGAGEGRR